MYYIASVSFGKDSLAMLLLILDNLDKYPLDEVIFFDWGMEFQAIYHNRDKIKPMLAARGIKFTELHYDTSFVYNFCEREVHKKDGSIQHGYSWCGGRTRWGTSRKNSIIKKNIIRHYQIPRLQNMQGLPQMKLAVFQEHQKKVKFCHWSITK